MAIATHTHAGTAIKVLDTYPTEDEANAVADAFLKRWADATPMARVFEHGDVWVLKTTHTIV